MARLEYRRMDDHEISSELDDLAGWQLISGTLTKEFAFKGYQPGLVFAAHVGYLADALNHHPDITIGYKVVTVAVSTHDVGGISPYDFELARRIDASTA